MQRITDRTEEFLSATAGKLRLAAGTTIHAVRTRAREERGQISAEFMGLLFIAALVIGAIVALDIHTTISEAVAGFIDNIKGGQSPASGGDAPPVTGNEGGG
jgi:hypothetical protein